VVNLIDRMSPKKILELANQAIVKARIVRGNLVLRKFDGTDINAGPIQIDSQLSDEDKLSLSAMQIEQNAFAKGKRLHAIANGSASTGNPSVTVAGMVPEETASTLTSPTNVTAWDLANSRLNPALRATRGRAVQAGPDWPKQYFAGADNTVVTYGSGMLTGTGVRLGTAVAFSAIDLRLFNIGGGTLQRIFVDGVLVATVTAATFAEAGVQPGYNGRIKLSFSNSQPRLIEWEGGSYESFPGYTIPGDQALTYPASAPKGARTLFVSDSFGEGTGADATGGLVQWMARDLGWADVWQACSGSVGYVSDGTRVALIDRYQHDIIDQAPDIIVIALGFNDFSVHLDDPETVPAAATTIWDAITSALPETELIIVGPWPNAGAQSTVDGTLIGLDTALNDLATARGLRFISPIREGWTYGTVDGTHPNPAGHEYLGMRIAGHLAVSYAPLVF